MIFEPYDLYLDQCHHYFPCYFADFTIGHCGEVCVKIIMKVEGEDAR